MGNDEITLDSVVAVAKQQVSSDLGDEVAILGLKRNTYYSMAGTGRRIWELLQTPRLVADILENLLAQYPVERDRCRDDLLKLLRRLEEEGLLEVTRPPEA